MKVKLLVEIEAEVPDTVRAEILGIDVRGDELVIMEGKQEVPVAKILSHRTVEVKSAPVYHNDYID